MKKNRCVKLFAILLCLLMLLSPTALVASATKPSVPPYRAASWEMSEDLEYIYCREACYERYYVRGSFYGDPRTKFQFMNSVNYDGEYCQIFGDSAYPHIVSVVTSPGYCTIFVDEVGEEILDSFVDGSDVIYYLENLSYEYSKLSDELVASLDAAYDLAGADLVTVDVTDLARAEVYEITAHDRLETQARQHGAVYRMSDGFYYYVCYRGLDNSYFDANGYFSYRSGSVGAYPIDIQQRLNVDSAILGMQAKRTKTINEAGVINGYYDLNGDPIEDGDGYYGDEGSDVGSIVLFCLTFAVFGVVIPGLLLTFGLIFANSKKPGRSKSWYALSIASAVWMLSAMISTLLIIL